MRASRPGLTTRVILIAAGLAAGLSGCGSPGIAEELGQVPALSFAHIRIEQEFDMTLLPEGLGDLIPVWLCDSMLERGPLGVSLLGINLTDLSPRLQFLTTSVDFQELADMAASGFACEQNAENGYVNLLSQGGSLVASVAGRDGWSCLIIGSGADAAASRWLDLTPEASLASDSGLIEVSDGEGELTLLVSQNTISFVMFIPDGMLSRAEKRIMQTVRGVIEAVGPAAIRFSFSSSGTPPYSVTLALELLREGGEHTMLTVDLGDTAISPDSLLGAVSALLGAGS